MVKPKKASKPETVETAKSLYERLAQRRDTFLRRARDCAKYTIPALFPPEGAGPEWTPPTPTQSVGSRGVKNLAAKLLLALLPPNTSFFRLVIDSFELKKIEQDQDLKTQLDSALSEIEQAVLVETETSAARTTADEAFQHLIVGGNGLLYVPPGTSTLKFYKLPYYVVERDPMGHMLTAVIKEQLAPSAAPEEVRKSLNKDQKDKTLELYTVCQRNAEGTRWDIWQEVAGIRLKNTAGSYPLDKCPFIPLRFGKVDGEDYGRSFVEDYLGDLAALETLSGALVEAGVAASKVLFLVAPNGLTDGARLAKARNGAFVTGRKEDVTTLQLEKYGDLRFVYEQTQAIERRMEMAFLLTSAIQRQAERVTAEEIRSLIQELETSLGGVYSVLAQEFQLPLANAYMARMSAGGRLPKLPKKIVRTTVSTGIEALGRGNDLNKLRSLMATIREAGVPPQIVARYLNFGDLLSRCATALAITTKGLIRSEEEVQAEMQQQQQMAMAQSAVEKLGPEAMRQMGAAQQQTT